ncbi:MAG TPA: enoyl-CoA hydratase/isomerase family protein [Anaerolineae bacterium]|mgnify:CR=1 FL=1|nr:enoyl-CoA hydratase/isomerase family protein [Anaerolineae bacterium]HRV93145.1 enoyl-CoA hydratase/isomerase family protein [Anaerolineae bacterium]
MNVKQPVLFSYHESIATITLNRESVYNAIDLHLAEALRQRLLDIEHDPKVRSVIITGTGRAFSGGGDLRFAHQASPDALGYSFLALTDVLHDSIARIRKMSKPVIAAINGPAAGAGFFLALACDLRVMAESAYLKQSNTSHGLSIPAGGTFTLPRMVGLAKALELALLDEPISAAQALQLGLVTKVTTDERLLDDTCNLAQRIGQMPIETIGRVKRLFNKSYYATLDEQLESERLEIAASAGSAEGREGIIAFLEKRQPNFKLAEAVSEDTLTSLIL